MWDIRVSECTEFVLLRLPDFLFIFLVHVQWTCYFGILWWIHDPNTFPFTFRISNENGLSSLFCAVFSSHFHRSLLDSFKLNDSHVFFFIASWFQLHSKLFRFQYHRIIIHVHGIAILMKWMVISILMSMSNRILREKLPMQQDPENQRTTKKDLHRWK